MTNANIATFNTMDSKSDEESRLRQNQVFSWFWLAITHNLLWLVLPDNVGMSITAFFLTSGLIITLTLDCFDSREQLPYVPKRRCPYQSLWIKSLLNTINRCSSALTKIVNNIKVRHKFQPPGFRYSGHHYKHKKY